MKLLLTHSEEQDALPTSKHFAPGLEWSPRRKGHLLVLMRGLGRWYDVEGVIIERPRLCPTGACDIREEEDERRERRENQ